MNKNYRITFPLTYKDKDLVGDVTAGLIVAVLFVPQSMAYANIAGVNPVYGLYAAAIPLLLYTILGSSRQLSVGPTSIISILAFSGVTAVAQQGSISYYEAIIVLSLMVGFILLIAGLLQIGRIVDLVSPLVISGFTFAAAIVIGLNQLDSLLGIPLSSHQNAFQLFINIIRNLNKMNDITALIGLGSLLTLILLKKVTRYPLAPFLLIVICPMIVQHFQLQSMGVSIIGYVPGGLPEIQLPSITFRNFIQLLPSAFTIAFISFIESFAIAKSIAEKEKHTLNTRKELFGIGIANIASSFVGSIPVGGAFSRTAVNYQSGAKTKLANLTTVILIIITLLYFTSYLYYLPNATLAAIVMIAVSSLVDIKSSLKKCNLHRERLLILVTFLFALTLGIFQGLLLGIFLSFVFSIFNKRS